MMQTLPTKIAARAVTCFLILACGDASASLRSLNTSTATSATVQELTARVLDFHRNVQEHLGPIGVDESTVNIYIGNRTVGLEIRSMIIRIDQGPPVIYRYDKLEGTALRGAALHKIVTTNLTPGIHRIHAKYQVVDIAASPRVSVIEGGVNMEFTKAVGPSFVEIVLSDGSYRAAPTLTLRNWNSDQ